VGFLARSTIMSISQREAMDNLPLTETVTPAHQVAVAGLIHQAWQDGTPLYPMGGGTRLSYGARPSDLGLGLSLTGLNRVVDYPARDLTITVEAGVTIAELAQCLAEQGQRLPIDVPRPSQATVGGAVAAGVAGPRQFRWGTMRDYVIGIRAVDGTGTAFSGGGRVVKNAAGYDLCRLLTGSYGTLGVIVQVTLMVKPRPETSAFVIGEVPDCDAAERLLAALVQTRTLPTAIELLAGPQWRNVGWVSEPTNTASTAGRVGDPSYPLCIAVGLEGSADEVQWMVVQLQEEWRAAGIGTMVTVAGEHADPLWDRLTGFSAGPSHANGDHALTVQINVLPSAVTGLVQRLRELDPQVSIQAHAGNGIVIARFSVGHGDAAALVDQRLRPEVTSAGGHMVVLAQPAGIALSHNTLFGPVPAGWPVMQSIKRQFDPKGILNRGRFLVRDDVGHDSIVPSE
jgi:glycolate oxidase FAD binding subunit